MAILLQFFLAGLALGASVCGMHVSFLLAPVAARGCAGWKDGALTGLFFASGKIAACAVLGGLAAHSGYRFMNSAGRPEFAGAAGGVLILLGLWFLFFRKKCGCFLKTGPPALLGMADGFIPCGPMLGFLVYMAYSGAGAFLGAAAGAFFGAGTAVVPAAAVCGAAPYVWKKVARFKKSGLVLRIAGASVFFIWGVLIFLSI